MTKKIKTLLCLHLLLMVYSFSGIFSKLASGQPFLSFKFIFFYGMIIFLLGIYAIFWQQIIKRMDLSEAYANKAVAIVWGIVWGFLFFHEAITIGKIIGAIIIIAGVVLFTLERGDENE